MIVNFRGFYAIFQLWDKGRGKRKNSKIKNGKAKRKERR
jgi:hypothetical protein